MEHNALKAMWWYLHFRFNFQVFFLLNSDESFARPALRQTKKTSTRRRPFSVRLLAQVMYVGSKYSWAKPTQSQYAPRKRATEPCRQRKGPKVAPYDRWGPLRGEKSGSRADAVADLRLVQGRGEGDQEVDSHGEAPARSCAGGGGAGFSGEQPGRRLSHAHLQLPQPDSRFDSLF